jgi:hypothetical protein
MKLSVIIFLVALVGTSGFTINCWAAGELHLKFHTSGMSGNQGFVRGTLINAGDTDISHGYVVVTLLDEQCSPLRSVLQYFGKVTPREIQRFHLPLGEQLRRYRLSMIKGFDTKGFEVSTVDDNAAIYHLREPEERAHCVRAKREAGMSASE